MVKCDRMIRRRGGSRKLEIQAVARREECITDKEEARLNAPERYRGAGPITEKIWKIKKLLGGEKRIL